MAHSSILGGDRAAVHSSGKSAGLLGPSDSSDSGSDALGELGPDQLSSDSDRAGTGERASADIEQSGSGADILPDQVVRLDEKGEFLEAEAEADGLEDFADLDEDDAADDAA